MDIVWASSIASLGGEVQTVLGLSGWHGSGRPFVFRGKPIDLPPPCPPLPDSLQQPRRRCALILLQDHLEARMAHLFFAKQSG